MTTTEAIKDPRATMDQAMRLLSEAIAILEGDARALVIVGRLEHAREDLQRVANDQ